MGSTQHSPLPAPRPAIALAVVALLAGAIVGGCSSAPSAAGRMQSPVIGPTPMSPEASLAAMPGMHHAPADAAAAWAARPAYARGGDATEEAYAYALDHPEAVAWMPCYCGCEAMDHRSNLDCYLLRSADGAPTQFEEHASYCEICVRTTLLTRQLLSEGRSLREIRATVDATFGGNAPGTSTGMPPA